MNLTEAEYTTEMTWMRLWMRCALLFVVLCLGFVSCTVHQDTLSAGVLSQCIEQYEPMDCATVFGTRQR